MEKGIIFNIQRFSVHDGPGIRTNVFFKGCPLRCKWCHNPEGLSAKVDIGYDARRCALCGACASACPNGCHALREGAYVFSRANCAGCGACAQACLYGALEAAGREETVESVMQVVRRDIPFYEDGGGMTLTGGEPTLQMPFARALAAAAKEEGIGVCVETCGFADAQALLALSANVDLFLFDVKELDPARHKAFTGVGNEIILSNLRALDASGAKTVLRCPLIPGYNANEGHMLAIAALANTLTNAQSIELEPYHPMGLGKAARFGIPMEASLPETSMKREDAEALLNCLRAHTGLRAQIN